MCRQVSFVSAVPLVAVCGLKVNRRMQCFDVHGNIWVGIAGGFSLLPNAMTSRFAVRTVAALGLALGTWARAACAQEDQHACITVPPVTRAQPASKAQLSIQV